MMLKSNRIQKTMVIRAYPERGIFMSYSIFKDTMADMSYPQIEDAAKRNLPIIFPIAVMEEHGPHLCLATDMYLTCHISHLIKEQLTRSGQDILIAPPYYWGINSITDGFAGSFTLKSETFVTVLSEILANFIGWGFQNIFLISMHGDFQHNLALLETAKRASLEKTANIYFLEPELPPGFLARAGIHENPPYVLAHEKISAAAPKTDSYMDVHAGAIETSLMADQFPLVTDLKQAERLSSSDTDFQHLLEWEKGGTTARNITPNGYLGNPSKAQSFHAGKYWEDIAGRNSAIILKRLSET